MTSDAGSAEEMTKATPMGARPFRTDLLTEPKPSSHETSAA